MKSNRSKRLEKNAARAKGQGASPSPRVTRTRFGAFILTDSLSVSRIQISRILFFRFPILLFQTRIVHARVECRALVCRADKTK